MTSLDMKVKAANIAGAYMNATAPLAINALSTFAGEKVVIKGGTELRQKVKDALPRLRYDPEIRAYYSASKYSVYLNVAVVQFCGEYYGRFETAYCVGTIERDSFLAEKRMEYVPVRADYSADEVRKNIAAVESARDALSTARNNLFPFDMQ